MYDKKEKYWREKKRKKKLSNLVLYSTFSRFMLIGDNFNNDYYI